MTGIEVGVPMAVVIILLASLMFFFFRKNQKQKRGVGHLQSKKVKNSITPRSGTHELEGHVFGELDITHYELAHPEAPRHELG